MPIETVARLFRSAVAREVDRQLSELAAARRPNIPPVPMDQHLAALPAIVPDPDDDPDDDEPPEEEGYPGRCSNPEGHKFECTGTAYGGDDERWHGEGRCLCVYCGADGDA
jgi:hypothetical protein